MERFYRWSLPASALVATCLGVFVLPFFFPPPYLQGISLANIAGFNNKVSWAAAAAVSLAVFLLALRWPWLELQQTTSEDRRPLSLRFRLVTTFAVGILIAGCSALIAYSGYRYNNDAYYFIHQVSMYTDYGRVLYDQIEFPYGPLLFYSPIVVRTLLSPFHVSAVGAYFTTLVLFQTTGMLLLGWMLNHLPIRHRWRAIFYLVLAVHAVQPCFGLNYTYLRFSASAAILLFAALQRSPWKLAAALFFGQFLSLALSPEMGFAFLAAGMGLAIWSLYTRGASCSCGRDGSAGAGTVDSCRLRVGAGCRLFLIGFHLHCHEFVIPSEGPARAVAEEPPHFACCGSDVRAGEWQLLKPLISP